MNVPLVIMDSFLIVKILLSFTSIHFFCLIRTVVKLTAQTNARPSHIVAVLTLHVSMLEERTDVSVSETTTVQGDHVNVSKP